MLGLDEIKIVKHVQSNIEHMDITENQKKALLNQLYQGIQTELKDEVFMSQQSEELKSLTA